MNHRLISLIAVIVLASIMVFALHFVFGYGVYCERNNPECVKRVIELKEECIPSTSKINWGNETDNFALTVVVERIGGKCAITEILDRVVGNPPEIPKGFTNTTYTINVTDGEDEGDDQDSVLDGIEMPLWIQKTELYKYFCGPEDYVCRDKSIHAIQNCINSVITDTEHKWYPKAYWTKYVMVTRKRDYCDVYFEIVDATDLPGDIPPSIVGMTMQCNIPYGAIPFQDLEEEWCVGPLYNYLQKL